MINKKVGILLVEFLLLMLLLSTLTNNLPTTDTEIKVVSISWEDISEEVDEPEVEQFTPLAQINETTVNEFTYEEAQLMLKVAQAEAGNQGEDGMWLVLSVVFNRVKDPAFPSSVEDVIYQPHQFSTVDSGAINKVRISPEAHLALARIEQGEVAPNIIGFETLKSHVLDAYFTEVFTYRDHKFYVAKEQEEDDD